ncbi:MAG: PPOX class F420-dependent oxidoreductase [Marmoricola sp.]
MSATTLPALADESFVSLTTFRASGKPVSTPVWIGRDALGTGDLLVLTPSGSGKVKRLRADARVELRPCDRRGRVAEGAPTATAVTEILDDPAEVDGVRDVMRRKYGAEYRIFMLVEALLRRTRHVERVGLRLRPAA